MSYKIEISAEDFLTSVINNTHFRCKKMQCTTSKLTCIARQKSPEIQHQSCHDCEQGKIMSGIKIEIEVKKKKGIVFNRKKIIEVKKNNYVITECLECGRHDKNNRYIRSLCQSCYAKFKKARKDPDYRPRVKINKAELTCSRCGKIGVEWAGICKRCGMDDKNKKDREKRKMMVSERISNTK